MTASAPANFAEPFRTTLVRTLTIAILVGLIVATINRHPLRFPLATLLALWFTLGGHYVELFFLNIVRPHLPARRLVQGPVRVAVWFIGGAVLTLGMTVTRNVFSQTAIALPTWWLGGVLFVVLELVVHSISAVRDRPNFLNGRS